MKPSLIAQRSAQAQAKIIAAVTALAAGVNVDASGLTVTARDPAIESMLRWEALAALLMSLPQPSMAPEAPAKRTKKGAEPDET